MLYDIEKHVLPLNMMKRWIRVDFHALLYIHFVYYYAVIFSHIFLAHFRFLFNYFLKNFCVEKFDFYEKPGKTLLYLI